MWAAFLVILQIISHCHAENILTNSGFEDEGAWDLQERMGMWKLRKANQNRLVVSSSKNHTGKKSLQFHPLQDQSFAGVFASQYYMFDNLPSQALPLEFSFWTFGESAHHLRGRLDIRYSDQRHMLVEVSPDNASDSFDKICIHIPAYGRVKSLMVHFTLEEKTNSSIYLDDVVININESFKQNCRLHAASFPVARQVLSNFLSAHRQPSRDAVTIATQMTMDRWEYLEETVQQWQGPVSAAVIVWGTTPDSLNKSLKMLITKYHDNQKISQYVTIHVVVEDLLNRDDSRMYPINFLRNIAIANVDTEYVFYVDADITPVFQARNAFQWIQLAGECRKCAFIVPVFEQKRDTPIKNMSKIDLISVVKDKESDIQALQLTSHSVINYKRWYDSTEMYLVKYKEDMEPYFIVHSESPVMNDLYAGYGRDKCAYSRDLHADGYAFHVLADAFMLNRRSFGKKSIYERSRGMPLRVWLNIAYHMSDIEHGESHWPSHYRGKTLQPDKLTTTSSEAVTSSSSSKIKQHGNGIGCNASFTKSDILPRFPMPSCTERKEILIKETMKAFNIWTLVEFPLSVTVSRIGLSMLQLDAVITIDQTSAKYSHTVKGIFERYSFSGNLSHTLRIVREEHSRPTLILIDVYNDEPVSVVHDVLLWVNDDDIILLYGQTDLDMFHTEMCLSKPHWEMYGAKNSLLLKSSHFNGAVSPDFPAVPSIVHRSEYVECPQFTSKTDLILLSRNRPMQTLAFLESLNLMTSGLNRIWLLVRMDDDIFRDAYQSVIKCFAGSLDIILVRDEDNFGHQLDYILKTSEAQYVVFAVDEIIWVRPVNFTYCACILRSGEGQFAAFDLRLGENIATYSMIDKKRFVPFGHDNNLLAFYPRQLEYNFGYIIHVDGTIMKRRDVMEELEDRIERIAQPGQLETGWIFRKLHIRSKRWHLMNRKGNLVNNMGLSDGRVANKDRPVQGSYDVVNMLVKDKRAIDVAHFIDTYKDKIKHTHMTLHFSFKDWICS